MYSAWHHLICPCLFPSDSAVSSLNYILSMMANDEMIWIVWIN